MNNINALFQKKLKVINMGLESFYKELKDQEVDVVHVEWRPPAGGNEKMNSLLARLKK